jgi:Mlc titration factor MtfA (ptsG expression regulator)
MACRNVVLHEFAHQLDAQDGTVEGTPILPDPSLYKAWSRILGTEYERLRREASLGRATLLDSYGATSPGEFFAVATECFFMQPGTLRERYPQLYDVMSLYYRQDPAADWSWLGEEASS